MSDRKVIPIRPTRTASLVADAQDELRCLVDDTFQTAKTFREAGDKNMAQAIERHGHGLRALLIMRRP